MPVYILDVFVLILSLKRVHIKVTTANIFFSIYACVSLLSYLVEFYLYSSYLSIYFGARWMLSYYSLFVMQAIQLKKDEIYKVLSISFLVNGFIAVAYALPALKFTVTPLFSFRFLYPPRTRTLSGLEDFIESSRAISLSAPSTTLILLLTIGFLGYIKLIYSIRSRLHSTVLLFLGALLFVTASLLTLSRGAALSLTIMVLILFFLSSIRNKLKFTVLGICLFWVIGYFFAGFDFSRITNTVATTSNSTGIGYSEGERIDAYIKPFEAVVSNKHLILLGSGLSVKKISVIPYKNLDLPPKGIHGLPGAVIYDRGLLAFLVMIGYLIIWYINYYRINFKYRFIFITPLFILLLSEHYLIDNIVGNYQFILFIVLISKKELWEFPSARLLRTRKQI